MLARWSRTWVGLGVGTSVPSKGGANEHGDGDGAGRPLGGRDAADGDGAPAGSRARAAVAVELPRAALRRRDLGAPRAAGVRRVRRPDARVRRRGAALPRAARDDARGRRGARLAALAA